jgi:hypothetical protein
MNLLKDRPAAANGITAFREPAWLVPAGGLTLADVDAIAARAEAAPGGGWVAFTDQLWIPWSAPDDDPPAGAWDTGRYLRVEKGDWHAGSDDPPPALWEFLASARADVLTLTAEVRRLRAALPGT